LIEQSTHPLGQERDAKYGRSLAGDSSDWDRQAWWNARYAIHEGCALLARI